VIGWLLSPAVRLDSFSSGRATVSPKLVGSTARRRVERPLLSQIRKCPLHPSASANGIGGAVMFGDNASERCSRSGSYSAVYNRPFTVDVVFELNNHELLITDYALDKIAD
jgi:hypothetical protein